MHPSIQYTPDKNTTNKKTNKHIQFDLSKNQTYIIDNDNSGSTYDNIPFITILVFTIFVASTILAYVNEYYVYAGFFGLSTVAFAIYLMYIVNKMQYTQ